MESLPRATARKDYTDDFLRMEGVDMRNDSTLGSKCGIPRAVMNRNIHTIGA